MVFYRFLSLVLFSAISISSSNLFASEDTTPNNMGIPHEKNPTTPAVDSICQPIEEGDSPAELRAKYVCEIEEYLPIVHLSLEMTKTPIKEQAKILNKLRRDIGKKYKENSPTWGKKMAYCRNHWTYGDILGPTYDYLKDRHFAPSFKTLKNWFWTKAKTDEEIIASSKKTGGEDLLLDPKSRDFVNNLDKNYGHILNAAWEWVPGAVCPIPH